MTTKKLITGLAVMLLLPQMLSMSHSTAIWPAVTLHTQVTAMAKSPEEQADEVLSILADVYPDDTLPNYILTAETPEFITAATTGRADQDNFNIFYYAENHPIRVDNQAVNELEPIASFSKTTYESDAEAIEAVNRILDLQGEEVDLGYGITGYMQGAAGSTYLNWQEGNWGLIVQASNQDQEDPVPLAQEVVNYLEDVFLPPPSDVGQITLRVTPGDAHDTNIVTWNEGNIVYQVTHFDPMQAVRMTGSISEPQP